MGGGQCPLGDKYCTKFVFSSDKRSVLEKLICPPPYLQNCLPPNPVPIRDVCLLTGAAKRANHACCLAVNKNRAKRRRPLVNAKRYADGSKCLAESRPFRCTFPVDRNTSTLSPKRGRKRKNQSNPCSIDRRLSWPKRKCSSAASLDV